MASEAASGSSARGVSAFARLGRAVVRRPFVPLVAWVVLVAAAAPFLSHLGAVTTSSTESVASNAPSNLAAARFAELFPGDNGASSTILLFYGPDVVGAAGQGLVLNVTAAIERSRALVDVRTVSSVYTAYSAYLAGETELAGAAIGSAETGSPNLTAAVNGSAELLWGPPALFVANWEALVQGSGPPASASNAPAYNETVGDLAGSPEALDVLAAFYNGTGGSATGFNGSAADCASDYPSLAAVVACADTSARANVGAILASLPDLNATIAPAVLAGMGIENSTIPTTVLDVAAGFVAASSGLPTTWVEDVWTWEATDHRPWGSVPAADAAAFANASVAGTTLSAEPLPVPLSISSSYVNSAGTASLITVVFRVADDATNASGGDPVDHDLGVLDGIANGLVAQDDPGGRFDYVQTGPAPLDALSSSAVNSSLALVLPLTVGLLLGITMIYFRSPLAPLVAFAGLGGALLLGLGGTVLVGTFVTHVDSTAIVLEEVFVLGVGTDYSIFLLARYREELVRGRSSEEAVVAAVTWAGQSIATSGSTAIIVTGALALSGVALLAQWGIVLSIAILITMLIALTLLPALLRLLGPKIFWPTTGARFERAAKAANARAAEGRTYFYRAARATARRPAVVVAAIVLVSIPLVAVALQVPVSYDFYDQLPTGHGATDGLAELNAQFGPGFAVPSYALVTFSAPLVAHNASDATEFTDLADLGAIATATPGIAVVRSPVGPYGASLAAWLGYAAAPGAVRANLEATLGGYLGADGRTVLFQLQPSAPGLAFGAVTAVDDVESAFEDFAASHPEVTSVAFGGGAPTIRDLANETDLATDVMLIAVTVGLVLVLLAVLRSWIIALMAVATIGLSISWAWAISDIVLQQLFGVPLFFYVRTVLIMLVLGLGIDYNIFLLTRVREERLRAGTARAATGEAVGRTGGIITAAAVILASAFGALLVGEFVLIRAIGFAVAVAVALDAMVVRTYLVPASLQLLGERVWTLSGRSPRLPPAPPDPAETR